MLRLRFRTRREFHLINSVLSLLESSLRMVVLFQTITSRRSPLSTWFSVFVEETKPHPLNVVLT